VPAVEGYACRISRGFVSFPLGMTQRRA